MKSKFSKNLTLFTTLFAGIALQAESPLLELGDNVNLYFNGSTSIRYQSNIFLQERDEESDTAFIFSPGVEVTFGRANAQNNASLLLRHDISVYSDADELDNDLFSALFDARFGSANFDGDLHLGFVQSDQASSVDLANASGGVDRYALLVERETFDARLRGEYSVSSKTSFSAAFAYNDLSYDDLVVEDANPDGTDFESRSLRDRETITVPVNVYYHYSPKLAVSAGYQYRQTEIDSYTDTAGTTFPGLEYEDHFFNIGIRGEVSPKVTSELRIGYLTRDFAGVPGGGDDESLGLDSSLTWNADARFQLKLRSYRDFTTGGFGDSIEQTGFQVSGTYMFDRNLSGTVRIGYRDSKYEDDREDETIDVGLGLMYTTFDGMLRLSANYVYYDNDSEVVLRDAQGNEIGTTSARSFENNIFNVSAALRY